MYSTAGAASDSGATRWAVHSLSNSVVGWVAEVMMEATMALGVEGV